MGDIKDYINNMKKWMRSFVTFNGKLDYTIEIISNGLEFYDNKFKTINNYIWIL